MGVYGDWLAVKDAGSEVAAWSESKTLVSWMWQPPGPSPNCVILGPCVIFPEIWANMFKDSESRGSQSQEPLNAAEGKQYPIFSPWITAPLSKFFPSFLSWLPVTSSTSLHPKLSSSFSSLPVWVSSGGFCALPGWSPTHLNHHRVPIQTLSLALSLPLLSDSPLPLLTLVSLWLKVMSSGVFCPDFAVMTSSLLLYALNPVYN